MAIGDVSFDGAGAVAVVMVSLLFCYDLYLKRFESSRTHADRGRDLARDLAQGLGRRGVRMRGADRLANLACLADGRVQRYAAQHRHAVLLGKRLGSAVGKNLAFLLAM